VNIFLKLMTILYLFGRMNQLLSTSLEMITLPAKIPLLLDFPMYDQPVLVSACTPIQTSAILLLVCLKILWFTFVPLMDPSVGLEPLYVKPYVYLKFCLKKIA